MREGTAETVDLSLRVGILGGGLMGSGISETVARSGHKVQLSGPIPDNRQVAKNRIATSVGRAPAAGKLAASEQEALIGRISYAVYISALVDSELVIEA
jgi:3-hydroxybutyryl-CoA dehydrogenase